MIYDHHIYVGLNISRDVCTAYELPGIFASGAMEKNYSPFPGEIEEMMIVL